MFRMMMIVALAASAGTAAVASTASIYLDSTNAAHVRYADLDLHSKPGRAKLASRIRGAADLLCTPATDILPSNDCFRAVIASGRTQMDAVVAATAARPGESAAR